MVYSAGTTSTAAVTSMMDSSTTSSKRRLAANGAPSANYLNGTRQSNMAAPKRLHRKQAIYHVTRVLWHLDVFRRSFRELHDHSCSGESCIFCALKELFRQFQLGGDGVLPPDALRKALASTFSTQERLQLGRMDDAAECFETILLKIHSHLASSSAGEKEDACSSAICVPHLRFAMALVEQSVCQACGVRSEPLPFTQMVHYVSASALITSNNDAPRHQRSQSAMDFSASTNNNSRYDSTGPEMFGKRLRRAGGMGDIRDCPSGCGAKIQICRSLMNRPDIVSVGIVWDSERPNLDHIMSVFGTLGTHLRLSDVFQSVVDEQWSSVTSHHLVGLVAYYGKNYSTFFFHSKLSMWIYFDDSSVREIGPYWSQVVDKCRRGHFQPLLLMYANPNGQPVLPNVAEVIANGVPSPSKHAPFFPPASGKSHHPYGYGGSLPRNLNGARRAITPNPDSQREDISESIRRRAITPNPDHHYNKTGSGSAHQSEDYSDYQNVEAFKHMFAKNGSFSVFAADKDDLDSSGMSEDKSSPSSPDVKLKVPASANFPGNRDSGNWSGDRNSASSSNSTSMENPYLYLPSGMSRKLHGNPTTNGKGTLKKSKENGYDSHSLSSNDSYPARIQQLPNGKHSVLSNIPEGLQSWEKPNTHSSQPDDCEKLCFESDKFFEISRLKEDSGDIDNAIAMCNTAATKARLAMDAPYNNPQAITFARMKHNACVMRLRSLQRRAVTRQESLNSHGSSASDDQESLKKQDGAHKGRHSRQGSKDSTGRRSSGHSRQNSGDGTLNSTQSSSKVGKNHEIFADNLRGSIIGIVNGYESTAMGNAASPNGSLPTKKSSSGKNIEIYATLPKKGGKKRMELELAMKQQEKIETIARLPRPKSSLEPHDCSNGDESSLSEMSQGDISKTKGDGKKQHKIRRKLLLGGLIKRKNRSMPDLRDEQGGGPEGQAGCNVKVEPKPREVSSRPSSPTAGQEKSSGYLSEGHSEYSNPNMERSKLMRRSFHHNAVANKQQSPSHFAKVPPPPPLRTTSKLSPGPKVKSVVRAMNDSFGESHAAPPLPPRNPRRPISWGCPQKHQDYENLQPLGASRVQAANLDSSVDSVSSPQSHSVTVMAQVHCPRVQEKASIDPHHSRQSSGEDFPEPPPPLESAIPDLIKEQAAGNWMPRKWAQASNLPQPSPPAAATISANMGAPEHTQRTQLPPAAPSPAKASFASSVRALTSRFETINSSFTDEPQKDEDVIPWRNPVNKVPIAPWLAQGGVDCVDAGPQQPPAQSTNIGYTGTLQRNQQPSGNFGAQMGADVVDARPAIHRLDEVLAEVKRTPTVGSSPIANQSSQFQMAEAQRTAALVSHPTAASQSPHLGASQVPMNNPAMMDGANRFAYQPQHAQAAEPNHTRVPSYGGTTSRRMDSPTQGPPPQSSASSMPPPEEKRNPPGLLKDARRPKTINKKNVRFNDQVTLVAQNDPDAESSLPNPILDRVLRNAGLKSEKDLVPLDPSLVSPQGSIASTDSQSSTQSGTKFGHLMGNPKSPPPYSAAAGSQFWQGFPPAGMPPGATLKPSSTSMAQTSPSVPPIPAQPIYDHQRQQQSNEPKYATTPAQGSSHPAAWSSPTMATPMATASYCSLCRKKVVMPPNLYCTDCDFYMAKLKASKS